MKNNYFIEIQFLGYRYHGWMKQPKVKTVQEMFEKTIAFIYKESQFKTMGTSRTDSKVSAVKMGVLLIIDKNIDLSTFIPVFNKNLPNDIKAISIKNVGDKFNPLDYVTSKHYVYLFAHNEKSHPFSAPLIHTETLPLNIELMMTAAKLFQGKHNFRNYTSKPGENTQFIRILEQCEIKTNDLYSANFFPEISYALHVKSTGFMRYQVRLIMGQLLALGKGELTLDDIKDSLDSNKTINLRHIAPGSGLILQNTTFKH